MNATARHSRRRIARRGVTLVELAVSIAVVSVLMVALGSVLVVAAKALPGSSGPGAADLAAGAALDAMASEMRFATSVTEATPTSLAFTVPDRDGDHHDETIRYAWSGTAGAPVTREYNGAAAVPVVPAANKFALSFNKIKHTTNTTVVTVQDSGEVLFATFSNWLGIVATSSSTNLTTSTWAAEKFTINQVTIPSDATRVAITRVSLKLKKPTSGTAGCTVGIYLPSAAGASTPAASPLGTPFTIPASSLTTSSAWVDSTFTDAALNNASNQSFVIVVKGVASTTSATLAYLNALLAPLDANEYRYTTNSGSTWLPSSSLNVNDAPFSVYGSYQRQVTTGGTSDTYTLSSASLMLQPTGSSNSRMNVSAQTVNLPSIAGP